MSKVISLRQPWASLVAKGYKPFEFRDRASSFRGECYIHASKTFDFDGMKWILARPDLPGYEFLCQSQGWVTGHIIGKVTIVDCLTLDQAIDIYPDNEWLLAAARGELGKRAFVLAWPEHFLPGSYIPCRGKVFPLFFDVEVDYADRVCI